MFKVKQYKNSNIGNYVHYGKTRLNTVDAGTVNDTIQVDTSMLDIRDIVKT